MNSTLKCNQTNPYNTYQIYTEDVDKESGAVESRTTSLIHQCMENLVVREWEPAGLSMTTDLSDSHCPTDTKVLGSNPHPVKC